MNQPQLVVDAASVLIQSVAVDSKGKVAKQILAHLIDNCTTLSTFMSITRSASKTSFDRSIAQWQASRSPCLDSTKPTKQLFFGTLLHDLDMVSKFFRHEITTAESTLDSQPVWTGYATRLQDVFTKAFVKKGANVNAMYARIVILSF